MTLLLSAAFAAPLLDIVSEASGGAHLFGGSQTGKTTALRCAASVWGKGDNDGCLRDWRATSNGLEGVAAETNDLFLPLDELGQADARELPATIYMLANGGGKSRATRDGSARPRRVWRSIILSTGEVPLAVKIAESGKRVMAGQEVRLISLRGDAGAGLGVFQHLHGTMDAASLANHLREAARTHYGTAGQAFLTKLCAERDGDPEGLADAIATMRKNFVAANCPGDADGQVRSVCARFALFAAAGELARSFGVVPWPEGEASDAAAACFRAWLAERGGSGPAEDAEVVHQVRAFIEAHGNARFEEIGGPIESEIRTLNRVGFRRREASGCHYLILPEAWRSEVCRGVDPKRAADVLALRGMLIPDTDRPDRKESIPRHGRKRVYVVTDAILAGGDE